MVSQIEIRSGFIRIKSAIKEHLKYEQYKKYYDVCFLLLLLVSIPLFSYLSQPKLGCVSGDCHNGLGVWNSKNGNIYEGNFKDGKANGQGTITSPNGDTTEGIFNNDNLKGIAVLTKNGVKDYGIFYNDSFYHFDELIEAVISKRQKDIEQAKNEGLAQGRAEAQSQASRLIYAEQQKAEQAQRALEQKNSIEAKQQREDENRRKFLGQIVKNWDESNAREKQCKSQCEGLSDEIDEERRLFKRPSSPRSRCLDDCD